MHSYTYEQQKELYIFSFFFTFLEEGIKINANKYEQQIGHISFLCVIFQEEGVMKLLYICAYLLRVLEGSNTSYSVAENLK